MWCIKTSEKEKLLTALKGAYDFRDVSSSDLPPKKLFFPEREITFTHLVKDGSVTTPPPPRKFVLYGLSLRDLEAITCLDEIMSAPEKDYYYFRRRRRALLIGVTGEAFDVPPGGDIIISSIDADTSKLLSVTEKGERAIKKHLPRLKKSKSPQAVPVKNDTMPDLRNLLMDAELLKVAVEWSWHGYKKLWEKLSRECLGCGICTYVCPLCHCFAAEDSVALSGDEAVRCRRWDACTLPVFARLGGGEDMHPGLRERYYNWFYHKFVRGYLEFGRSECVACGRCQRDCPARIDIEAVLLDIVSAYSKSAQRRRRYR